MVPVVVVQSLVRHGQQLALQPLNPQSGVPEPGRRMPSPAAPVAGRTGWVIAVAARIREPDVSQHRVIAKKPRHEYRHVRRRVYLLTTSIGEHDLGGTGADWVSGD